MQTRIDYQLFDYHYMEQEKSLTGEIVLYQPDDTIRLEVRMDDEVYHIGASIKDLGKKWFAFALMNDLVADKFLEMLNPET